MISPLALRQQLNKIGIGSLPLCRAELRQLPVMMLPGEEVQQLLTGRYIAGYAIMVATNYRLLVIDSKLGGGLIFENVPYDMIAEVEYMHAPFSTKLIVFARSKKIIFRTFQGAPVREFTQYLEGRIMETRQQFKQMQEQTAYGIPPASYQRTGSY